VGREVPDDQVWTEHGIEQDGLTTTRMQLLLRTGRRASRSSGVSPAE
jgi:hypothetical protein